MRRIFVIVLLCFGALVSCFAQRWGIVNFSVAYLRAAPDYESALETQLLMGNVVQVLERDGYWLKVASSDPQYEAWVTELAVVPKNDKEMMGYITSPTLYCTADYSHVYSEPSLNSLPLSELVLGDVLIQGVTERGKAIRSGQFLKAVLHDGREGWVPKKDVIAREGSVPPMLRSAAAPVGLRQAPVGPRSMTGELPAPVKELPAPESFSVSLAGQASPSDFVANAQRFIGIPYLWGGNTIKGLDCSGLVWMAGFLSEVQFPRNVSQQARLGVEVPLYAADAAEDALPNFDVLQPGDLIFFGTPASDGTPARYSHVAISLGGDRFVHASQVVRYGSLSPSSPDYYDRRPLMARRVL